MFCFNDICDHFNNPCFESCFEEITIDPQRIVQLNNINSLNTGNHNNNLNQSNTLNDINKINQSKEQNITQQKGKLSPMKQLSQTILQRQPMNSINQSSQMNPINQPIKMNSHQQIPPSYTQSTPSTLSQTISQHNEILPNDNPKQYYDHNPYNDHVNYYQHQYINRQREDRNDLDRLYGERNDLTPMNQINQMNQRNERNREEKKKIPINPFSRSNDDR